MAIRTPVLPAERPSLVPITLGDARRFVAAHHRHNDPPRGHRFSVGLTDGTGLIGVVIAGRPVARAADDGFTLELLRVTTTGRPNACSMLYGAACRAAQAMGYRAAITYTLADESGVSLRAAGFRPDEVSTRATRAGGWDSREGRAQPRLFDPPLAPSGPKVRWRRDL